MKLNNFFTKSVAQSRSQTQVFRLGNESRETELEQRIHMLQKEVASLKDMTSENIELTQSVTALRQEIKTLRKEHDTIYTKTQQQQTALDKLLNIEIAYNANVIQLKEFTYQIEQLQAAMDSVTAINSKQQMELTTLNDDYITLSSSYGTLKHENTEKENFLGVQQEQLHSQAIQLEQFHRTNEETTQAYSELQGIYGDSLDHINYWKGMAGVFADQIDDFKLLEQKLTSWIERLTAQNNQETSRSKGAASRLDNSQSLIDEMNMTMTEMAKEQEYLQETNANLRLQVAEPQYISVGAIQRLENFAMAPMGSAINRNKIYLGNAKPTMLKFKSREEEYDNN